MYRNTTPAPKVEPAGRCRNINSVDQLRHPKSEAYSAEQVLLGNSPDNLRHTRSVAYSVELVVLNKHQISGGGAYPDCYRSTE